MTTRLSYAIAAALAAGTLAAAPARGQTTPSDGHWRAWIGCWQPVTPDDAISATDPKALRVCVVPAAGTSAVDILNVVNGKVAERTHVEASGARQPIGREGCTGLESAEWSADSLRVYLKADITCDGVKRTTSGILAFAPNGEWLDVQGVTTGQNSGVHVTRYRAVTDLAGIPTEVTSALANQQLAVSTARGAAMAPVAPTAVVDAVKHVESPVVQAWLLERGQGFAMLDAKQLVALADAGVPGSVTDLMVALTYPKQFAINRGGQAVSPAGTESASGNDVVTGRTIPVYVDTYGYSPFGWGPYGSYYSWYGYSPYYLPYGYGGYGYGGYGYGYTGPIIITRPSDGGPSVASHPHVVRGQGYTEGRTSTPSSSSGTRSSAGSSSSGSSSSSPSSSSSGASSSGGGRTAHRVP